MGQGNSKPESTGKHVFKSENTPVTLSSELAQDLSSRSETNNSRTLDRESHVQARVKSELERLTSEQAAELKKLTDSISAIPDSERQPKADAPISDAAKAKDLGRERVQKEIATLKEKLEKRKIREDIVNDKAIGKTKDELVKCLRENDRRPLDCWQEVEAFKSEVARLEKNFLGKVLD